MDKISRTIQKELDDFLWCEIKSWGGLHRDRERWSAYLSPAENRRNFRSLDRADGRGQHLDDLGTEIGGMFPEYGIHNGDDLWAWLQRSRVQGGDVLCERLGMGWVA